MAWTEAAAVISLVVAVASAAYSFGVLKTRLDDQHNELTRLRDKIDKFMEYWRQS